MAQFTSNPLDLQIENDYHITMIWCDIPDFDNFIYNLSRLPFRMLNVLPEK